MSDNELCVTSRERANKQLMYRFSFFLLCACVVLCFICTVIVRWITVLKRERLRMNGAGIFYRPNVLPGTQPAVSKHWREQETLTSSFLTFRVRRSRGEMYIGHARLCVCVWLTLGSVLWECGEWLTDSVCLSLVAFPHYYGPRRKLGE